MTQDGAISGEQREFYRVFSQHLREHDGEEVAVVLAGGDSLQEGVQAVRVFLEQVSVDLQPPVFFAAMRSAVGVR